MKLGLTPGGGINAGPSSTSSIEAIVSVGAGDLVTERRKGKKKMF